MSKNTLDILSLLGVSEKFGKQSLEIITLELATSKIGLTDFQMGVRQIDRPRGVLLSARSAMMFIFGLLILSSSLIGCTQRSETPMNEGLDLYGATTVYSREDLPKCKKTNMGAVYYITDSQQLVYCDGQEYVDIDISGMDGEDGKDGQDGVSYIIETRDASDEECPAGGVVFNTGPDDDGDGEIDDLVSTHTICNGLPGEELDTDSETNTETETDTDTATDTNTDPHGLIEQLGTDLLKNANLIDDIPDPLYDEEHEQCVDIPLVGRICTVIYELYFRLQSVTMNEVELVLDPREDGTIGVTASYYGISAPWSAEGVIAEIDYSASGNISAVSVVTTMTIILSNDNGTVTAGCTALNTSSTGFESDFDSWMDDTAEFFGVDLTDLARDHIEDAIRDSVTTAVPQAVETVFNDLQ